MVLRHGSSIRCLLLGVGMAACLVLAGCGKEPGDEGKRVPVRLELAANVHPNETEDRALLAMRYVAGLNATEIADFGGGSPSTIRSRLARLLARLREELGDVLLQVVLDIRLQQLPRRNRPPLLVLITHSPPRNHRLRRHDRITSFWITNIDGHKGQYHLR